MPMQSTSQPLAQYHADYLSLVEISDLHLFNNPNQNYNHVNPEQNLSKILDLLKQQFVPNDLVVLTGDLLQEPSRDCYDRLFAKLDALDLNYVAVAGNHDVTLELDSHLPFVQRRHLPVDPDNRLLHRQVIHTPFWNLIMLDSTVKGQIYGHFSDETLAWLENTLAASEKPCVIFAHHPMTSVNSYWIDQHSVQNPDAFWRVVLPFRSKVKGIFVGHVHQECHIIHKGISMFSTPATSMQFKPFAHDYAVDNVPAGLRWLTLYNNGKLATGVKRLDTI